MRASDIFCKIALTFSLLLLSLSCATEPVQSAWDDYVPLSKIEIARKMRVSTASDTEVRFWESRKIAGCRMSLSEDGDLVFSGQTESHKAWSISKHYYSLGSFVFTTDLDRKGTKDIVLVQATGACGVAPSSVLTTILFDRDGKPFPSELFGSLYGIQHNTDCWSIPAQTTIEGLLKCPDNRAVLISEQLDFATVNGKRLSYWKHGLYKPRNARWLKLSSYRGFALPLVVRYRFKQNHRIVTAPPDSVKVFDDGSCDNEAMRRCKFDRLENCATDENRNSVHTLLFSNARQKKNSSWPCFESFVFRESRDRLEIAALTRLEVSE